MIGVVSPAEFVFASRVPKAIVPEPPTTQVFTIVPDTPTLGVAVPAYAPLTMDRTINIADNTIIYFFIISFLMLMAALAAMSHKIFFMGDHHLTDFKPAKGVYRR
jgi:hypothetical protein